MFTTASGLRSGGVLNENRRDMTLLLLEPTT